VDPNVCVNPLYSNCSNSRYTYASNCCLIELTLQQYYSRVRVDQVTALAILALVRLTYITKATALRLTCLILHHCSCRKGLTLLIEAPAFRLTCPVSSYCSCSSRLTLFTEDSALRLTSSILPYCSCSSRLTLFTEDPALRLTSLIVAVVAG
jgi:hypothetical protein